MHCVSHTTANRVRIAVYGDTLRRVAGGAQSKAPRPPFLSTPTPTPAPKNRARLELLHHPIHARYLSPILVFFFGEISQIQHAASLGMRILGICLYYSDNLRDLRVI